MLNRVNKKIIKEGLAEIEVGLETIEAEKQNIIALRNQKSRDEDSVRYDNIGLDIDEIDILIDSIKRQIASYKRVGGIK